MASITVINGSDSISGSRSVLNTNFSNLNSDKIETSVIDTDTTLAANSDDKIPSQKAVKAYVDAGGNVNASTTTKGIVEEATQAEMIAGTGAGGTGARLFLNPTLVAETGNDKIIKTKSTGKLDTSIIPETGNQYVVGSNLNSLGKTYYNVHLLFILWTGAVVNDTTTTFSNWTRSSTDVDVRPGGAMLLFDGTGADSIYCNYPFFVAQGDALTFAKTNIVIMDWWAKLPSSGTGDINMGYSNNTSGFGVAYNDSTYDRAMFSQLGSTGALYATISNAGVGVTNTDISSGITVTNWNNFRIELDLSNNALFYVNGVLKATLSGANLPDSSNQVIPGFGRSNTSLCAITAPTISLQMNP